MIRHRSTRPLLWMTLGGSALVGGVALATHPWNDAPTVQVEQTANRGAQQEVAPRPERPTRGMDSTPNTAVHADTPAMTRSAPSLTRRAESGHDATLALPSAAPVGISTQGGAPDHTFRFATAIRRDAATALTDLASLSEQVDGDEGQTVQIADLLPSFAHRLAEAPVKELSRLYGSSSTDVRREAARLLATYGDDQLVRRFIEDQRVDMESDTADVRADAAWELGRLGGDHSVRELTKLLHDPSSDVVLSALRSLLECDGHQARGTVAPLVEHELSEVRHLAASALARWDAEAHSS